MFFLPRLKRINADAFIAAGIITQFTPFGEDEIHAIQFTECLTEECNSGVNFIHYIDLRNNIDESLITKLKEAYCMPLAFKSSMVEVVDS